MTLRTSLPEFSNEVNQTLREFFAAQEKEAKAINSSLSTSLKMLEDFCLRGGKTIRPFLVQLGYDLAVGIPNQGLIKAAAAVELHHRHILILDDIADRDQKRYGGPTLEWAYRDMFGDKPDAEHRARSFAMLDAVWLGALARELLFNSGFDDKKLVDVSHVLNTTMFRDTLAGWQIHALECTNPISETTPEEFSKGLQLVTASYTFEGPLKIGLILAGNQDQNLGRALKIYSQKIGTAFQIHDDILGLFGDTKITGKPVGNDIREGKKTLLVQYAYKKAGKKGKELLDTTVGNSKLTESQLKDVQKLIQDTGALVQSQEQEKQMVTEGLAALASLKASPAKELLTELAEYIVTREK